MMKIKTLTWLLLLVSLSSYLKAQTGYDLWLKYPKVSDASLLEKYQAQLKTIDFEANSAEAIVAKKELLKGLNGLLGKEIQEQKEGSIIVATTLKSALVNQLIPAKDRLGLKDGFIIKSVSSAAKKHLIITSETDLGLVYGVFHFLKLLQTQQQIADLFIREIPKIDIRILNHWDNLDGTVERGYAGNSLWDWHKLPGFTETRYTDYARANASVGINGTVLNNVNANSLSLTKEYIEKASALADVFRPYGIKVYLSARFSSPIEIGGLKTADPLDAQVKAWWKAKVDEIYKYIPNFGGFLVKANSEGQPGPQSYGRTHADGANMLADALAPHHGIVMWRAFVYDDKVPDDRAKQAFNEFKPLDGTFRKNVFIQVKNGAIDFQPREPFHPLFGAMPKTPLMMEFQITQEYLGFATHLVYLGKLFEETLQSDTYAQGKGSTVSKIIQGKMDGHQISGMAGVANIGTDMNWTGHPFAQANWYSFGRLAWNPDLSSAAIAQDWIKLTFTQETKTVEILKNMMILSREAVVNYMTPLGLHHIMARNHHYGPGPWVKDAGRPDWTSVYYHKADSMGIGFDRTSKGSDAVSQYHTEVAKVFESSKLIPENQLLWFHHVSWNARLNSGKTLWEELVAHYYQGVDEVKMMQQQWETVHAQIEEQPYQEVKQLLQVQYEEAKWWRDACLLYFQTFSKLPLPAGYEKPAHNLDFYKQQRFYFVPGIKN